MAVVWIIRRGTWSLSAFLLLCTISALVPKVVIGLTSCTTVIQVSRNYRDDGCVQANGTGSIFLCSSLQAGLDLASSSREDSSNCTEMILSASEQFSILRPVIINSSLVLRSSDPQTRARVTVSCDKTPQPPDYEPFYALTISNTQLAVIHGVEFSRSSGIIGIARVDQAFVSDCVFSYFSEGALDIYDCPVVTVSDSLFEHNGPVAYTLKRDPFRSHSGGLSIGCNNLTLGDAQPAITVQNSVFTNNSAFPSTQLVQTTSQIYRATIFTGRGGALGLIMNHSQAGINARLENCTFVGNGANSFGGGTYVLFGSLSAHVVTIFNCTYLQNWSKFGGGGVFGGFFGTGFADSFSLLNVTESLFVENSAVQGAGTFIALPGRADTGVETNWNYVRFEYSIFRGNVASDYAAAITVINPEIFRYRSGDKAFEIANCKFLDNVHRESTTLGVAFAPISFEGHNIFDGGTGGAIQLAGSLMTLSGRLDITNNDLTGTNNGALQFVSFSQLRIFRGSEIHFENNRGTIGASVTVESLDSYATLERLQYNPLCFLLYEDLRVAPDEWTDIAIYFDGNQALVGAVGFLTSLDTCSWIQAHDPFFDNKKVLNWEFVHLGENTNLFHEQNPQDPLWYTQTNVYSVNIRNTTVHAYPGEKVSLQIIVLDELDQPVGSVMRLLPRDASNMNDMNLILEPSVELYGQNSQTFDTVIHTGSNVMQNNTPIGVVIDNYLQQTNTEDSFEVYQEPCPGGYVLSNLHEVDGEYECLCNINDSNILFCDEGVVVFKDRLWAIASLPTEEQLFEYPCPAGYCQCKVSYTSGDSACVYSYDSADPDQQCSCKRSGVLCGSCTNGSGFSALLNRCVSCGDSYALLIPFLAFVDVVALVLIVVLMNKSFPDWLYPCLFFVQFLPFATEPIPFGFEIIRRYLLFIASGLSFYFPYDLCLYDGATAVVTYLFRFTPLLVDIVVFPITLLFMRYFLKRRFTKPWYSVCLVVILQYTHIVYSAMSVLHCVRIPVNGSTELRWFVNGEVQCFTSGHLPLTVLAVVVLALCVALIPVTILLLYKKDTEQRIWFQRLTQPLSAGFKSTCYWWFPVELGRRFLLLLMVVPFPGSVYPVLFGICVLATMSIYVQPYKSKLANFLDSIFWVNAIALFLISIPEPFQTLESYNVTDPISGCSGENASVYIFTTNIYVLFINYYFPLLVTGGTVVGFITIAIFRKWKPQQISKGQRERTFMYELDIPFGLKESSVPSTSVVTYELLDVDRDDSVLIQDDLDSKYTIN